MITHGEDTMVVTSEFLTVRDVALRWHVTERTLQKWVASGLLPIVKIGPRRVLVRWSDVRRFETANSSAVSDACSS